jgi:hypothetical protein
MPVSKFSSGLQRGATGVAVGAEKVVGGSLAGGIEAVQLIGVRFTERRVVRRERAVADSASIQSRTKFDPMNPRPEPLVMRMVFFINLGTMKFHESPRMRRRGSLCGG